MNKAQFQKHTTELFNSQAKFLSVEGGKEPPHVYRIAIGKREVTCQFDAEGIPVSIARDFARIRKGITELRKTIKIGEELPHYTLIDSNCNVDDYTDSSTCSVYDEALQFCDTARDQMQIASEYNTMCLEQLFRRIEALMAYKELCW